MIQFVYNSNNTGKCVFRCNDFMSSIGAKKPSDFTAFIISSLFKIKNNFSGLFTQGSKYQHISKGSNYLYLIKMKMLTQKHLSERQM